MSWTHFKRAAIFFAAILFAAHCFAANTIAVTTVPVTYHALPKTITAYGKIISPDSLDIMAQSSGEITSIHFNAGDAVKKGQILFTLTSNNIDDQTKKLFAAMQLSRDNYKRLRTSYKADPESVSPSDLLDAKLKFIQDLAAYREARTVEKIIAPADGVISTTPVAAGSFVNVGAVLAHVSVPTSKEIAFQLPSQYQPEAAINQTVEFIPSDTKTPYSARVTYISPALNSDDYSVNVRAAFDQPNHLPENLFGKIIETLQIDAKTLAVPASLVQADSQGFYVYSLSSNNKAKKIYFIPGAITKDGLMMVHSGISNNTPIISSHLSSLIEGQQVAVSHS